MTKVIQHTGTPQYRASATSPPMKRYAIYRDAKSSHVQQLPRFQNAQKDARKQDYRMMNIDNIGLGVNYEWLCARKTYWLALSLQMTGWAWLWLNSRVLRVILSMAYRRRTPSREWESPKLRLINDCQSVRSFRRRYELHCRYGQRCHKLSLASKPLQTMAEGTATNCLLISLREQV